jgi:Tol biopolymer transport system component/DNA-binding winged helix-turn-helix (wHTH) protein
MQKMIGESAGQDSLIPLAHNDNLLYEFDNFIIDVKNQRLVRDGKLVPLAAKTFEILLVLIENNGRTLEKSDLLNRIWPETFVEEINLNVHISNLRKALGESAARHQYIKTIPKRGYCFTAPVEEVESDKEILLQEIESPPQTTAQIDPALQADLPEEAIPLQVTGEIEYVKVPVSEKHLSSQTVIRSWKITGKRNSQFAVLTLLMMALTVSGIYLYSKRKELLSASTPPFQKVSKRKLTAYGKNVLPTLSPDGEYVAYVLDDAGKQSLWIMQVETKSCVQIIAPTEVSYNSVTFAPDGKFLYYDITDKQYQSALYQVPILGGTPRKILTEIDSHIAISPNGKQVAFVKNDYAGGKTALVVANVDGNEKRVLMTRQRPELVSNWGGVAWSPDGKMIACAVRTLNLPTCYFQAMTVRVEDSKETPLGPDRWADIGQIAWLDNNRGILVSAFRQEEPFFGSQLWYIAYPGGEITKLTDDLISYEGVSLANHSQRLVTSTLERISRIWLLKDGKSDTAKQTVSVMGDNRSELFGMDWTPDGQLVYGSHGGRNSDIWIMNADGVNQRQLTFDESQETSPVVSADGRYIVYVAKGAGPPHLWRMDINGENPLQLTDGKGEQDPSISPDGKTVFYNAFNSGVMSLNKISINGGEVMQVTHEWSIRPNVSPDGKYLAFIKMDDNHKRMVVALMPFTGGEPIKVFPQMPVPEHMLLRWSPDGRALHYIYIVDGIANIWSQPIDGSSPVQITHFKSDNIFRFAWSRDGRNLALDRGVTISDVVLINDMK